MNSKGVDKMLVKTLILTLFLIVASNVMAEDYKAPSFKLKKLPHHKAFVKKDNEWESDLNYKVEENLAKKRNVASDEDEDQKESEESSIRGPSSEQKSPPKSDGKPDLPRPRPWNMDK